MTVEETLRKLGMVKYEILLYTTLVRMGIATSVQLSKASGVPYGRIYDTLHSLELRGFIKTVPGKPKKFKATPPEIALEMDLKKKEKEISELKKEAESAVKELKMKTPKAEEHIFTVKGKEQFYPALVELLGKANKEILGMAGPLGGETHPYINKLIIGRIKKGVKMKMLVNITKENFKRAKELIKAGYQVKNYPTGNARMNIVDRKLLHITCGPERAGVFIEDEELAELMAGFFEYLWKKAGTAEKKIRELKNV